jgi:hypothetical protein
MTTNKSPRREKLGIPVGEVEVDKIPEKYKSQQDIERMNDNSPEINEKNLEGKNEYIVNMKKSPDKKDRARI